MELFYSINFVLFPCICTDNSWKDKGLLLLAIVDIPEYSALSKTIVELTREGMGKIVNNPKAIKLRSKPTNLTSKNAW